MRYRRREFIKMAAGGVTLSLSSGIGCTDTSDWCEEPQFTQDGPYRTVTECIPTAASTEGPFYITNAPTRADLRIFGDTGTTVELSGRVVEASCREPLIGAVVEIWHASPNGEYDNVSPEMRYRCQLSTDSEGRYSLLTLLPGRYLNGDSYRPRHLHIKVWDSTGNERLTTQFYFARDPYLECDSLANQSLVLQYEGSETTQISITDADLILS